jgi:PAS domain S-box-containing protein
MIPASGSQEQKTSREKRSAGVLLRDKPIKNRVNVPSRGRKCAPRILAFFCAETLAGFLCFLIWSSVYPVSRSTSMRADSPSLSPPGQWPTDDPIEKIILRSMNEGVITLECNGTVHTFNPAAERILGLREEDLRGCNIDDLFGGLPENRELATIFHDAIQARARSERRETQFKRRDGQVVDLSVTSAFLAVDVCEPSLQSVMVVFRDITAFKSLERVKRRAVNHLSHELKTPLAIARASVASLIQKECPRDQSLKRLQRAQRSLERLCNIQNIVEEVLNPPLFEPREIDAAAVVDEIVQEIRVEAAHRSVVLRSEVGVREIDRLDPDLLRTVILALVKNAIENTPDGGDVLVSLKYAQGGLLLEVSDSGVGILVQDQEFIFEGFLYTQATQDYSSKKPFDFGAGGKGLELLRLKVLSETGYFAIGFDSRRCASIPTDLEHCPGTVDACAHVRSGEECRVAGGTTFWVLFPGT